MSNKLIVNLWKGTDLPAYSADVFGPEDVVRLWRGANRCISDLEMHVLCDEYYYGKLEGPWTKHLLPKNPLGGWADLLEPFNPELIKHDHSNERILRMDLDTVLIRNIDWIFDWNISSVGLSVDPYNKTKPAAGVVTFNAHGGLLVWNEYQKAKQQKEFPYRLYNTASDMMLLRALFIRHKWKYFEKEMKKIRSLKGCELVHATTIPEGTDIVYLHGKPKILDLDPQHPVRLLWERE